MPRPVFQIFAVDPVHFIKIYAQIAQFALHPFVFHIDLNDFCMSELAGCADGFLNFAE
jgi:hypothetical protein